jgi:hypothetical protein
MKDGKLEPLSHDRSGRIEAILKYLSIIDGWEISDKDWVEAWHKYMSALSSGRGEDKSLETLSAVRPLYSLRSLVIELMSYRGANADSKKMISDIASKAFYG